MRRIMKKNYNFPAVEVVALMASNICAVSYTENFKGSSIEADPATGR